MVDDFLYFDYFLCRFHTDKIKTINKVYREKILSAFSDIEHDVNNEMDRILHEYPFNPDFDDPEDIMERAYEKGIDYGIDLSEAKCLFIAVLAITLYHDWEKSIIAFLNKEIGRNNPVPNISKWDHIIKWLEKYDTKLETFDLFYDLNELRLVVNSIKHGEGSSLNKLRELNSTILLPKENGECSYSAGEYSLLGVDLYIEQSDLERYEKALLKFWDHQFWLSIGEQRCRKDKQRNAQPGAAH